MAARPHRHRESGFTLLELLIGLVIIGILATLAIPAYTGLRERAQRVQCLANLRALYLGADLYLQRNGSWPQIRSNDYPESTAFADVWIDALTPYGVERKTWICPTIQGLLGGPDYTVPDKFRIDYFATPFDDKSTTPHRWPRQPWFIEAGDVHGSGNLIIFTDGSISSLADVPR